MEEEIIKALNSRYFKFFWNVEYSFVKLAYEILSILSLISSFIKLVFGE